MSPDALIETERLRLRVMTPDALGELVRLQEDPEVSRFMGRPSREWLESWLRSSQAAVAECLGMSPLRDDKLLGDAVTVYAIRR